MDLFRSKSVREYNDSIKGEIKNFLDKISEDTLLNIDDSKLIQLIEKFSIQEPVIHFDRITFDEKKEMMSGEYFPASWDVRKDRSYERTFTYFYIPCENINLLILHPTSFTYPSFSPTIKNNNIVIKFNDFSNDETLKRNLDRAVFEIDKNYKNLLNDIRLFNSQTIKTFILEYIEKRRKTITRRDERSRFLGIEKVDDHHTEITSIVSPKDVDLKLKVDIKIDKGLTLNQFYQINELIYKSATGMESKPDTYKGLGEEGIRQIIIHGFERNILNASVVAEALNNRGKTDILIKRNDKVLYVSECKFWKGPKVFKDTINQLKGYLIHTDLRSSILIFVDNVEINSVLKKIKTLIMEDESFESISKEHNDNWIDSKMYLDEKRDTLINISFMIFHFPKQ